MMNRAEQSAAGSSGSFPDWFGDVDPFGIGESLLDVQIAWLNHPRELGERLFRLGCDMAGLQAQATLRMLGVDAEDMVPAVPEDERFLDEAWKQNPVLDLVKEHYLLHTRWLEDAIYATPGTSDRTRRRAAFWTRQFLNALSPSNAFWSNPVALQRFIETGGWSVVQGLENACKDAQRRDISMVEPGSYVVGRDLAVTPGQVVMRNELVELIQYAPTTEETWSIPIVIVAPWINKYYILDLTPAKSLVRFLVSRGFTVFITSWKNPTADMRDTTLDDYMMRGIHASIETARSITGAPKVHAVGYCLGGTMLAALMAWLAAGDAQDEPPVADWTLFTALVDFTNPGDIDVFIDERSVAWLEKRMQQAGYLDAADMGWSFRMLRSNSLVWRYIVHGYMYGETPPAFDVLHWNTDGTRLPAAMHAAYLRNLYLENRLAQPGSLTLAGRAIDLRRIEAPLYAVGTEQDHIAPWKESFRICSLASGPVRFALASSGHILGIVNPPSDKPKGGYWAGDASGAGDPDAWRMGLERVPGSWWNDWAAWLEERSGLRGAPPPLGNAEWPPLLPAPGSYVLET